MNPYYTHFLSSKGGRDPIYQSLLAKFQRPVNILEIGVARDLSYPARDSDGWSSLFFAQHVKEFGGHVDFVDASFDSIINCQALTEGFKNLSYHVSDGIRFLETIYKEYDIINLDAGDDPELTKTMYDLAKKMKPSLIILDDFHTKGSLIPKDEVVVHHWENGHEMAWTKMDKSLV